MPVETEDDSDCPSSSEEAADGAVSGCTQEDVDAIGVLAPQPNDGEDRIFVELGVAAFTGITSQYLSTSSAVIV